MVYDVALKYPVIKFEIECSLGFEFLRNSCDPAQEEQFRVVPILLCVPFGERLRQRFECKLFPWEVSPGNPW